MPWVFLGLAAIVALAFAKKGGGDGDGQSPFIKGQSYHVIVRFGGNDPNAVVDPGVIAPQFGFVNVREAAKPANSPDPFVIEFVADWARATGTFIQDSPEFRIIAVTPLTGNG